MLEIMNQILILIGSTLICFFATETLISLKKIRQHRKAYKENLKILEKRYIFSLRLQKQDILKREIKTIYTIEDNVDFVKLVKDINHINNTNYINLVEQKSTIHKEKCNTLTEKYLESQLKKNMLTGVCLTVILISGFIIKWYSNNDIGIWISTISCIYMLLLVIKIAIEAYRVNSGLFGSCFFETKKLIEYIGRNNNNNGGNTSQEIFLSEDEYAKYKVAKDIFGGVYEH